MIATMSTVIAIISQKGGVGKSTLARALGTECARSDLKVKIADLDTQQGTTTSWHRLRCNYGHQPVFSVEGFPTAAAALAVASQYDLLIVDGPARTSKATLEIARSADLVIQPTGPSLDDMEPAVKEFHALKKAGIPLADLVFVLTRVGTDAEEEAGREYLTKAGYAVLPGSVPERPSYRKAQNEGLAITEIQYAGLRQRADAVIQALINQIPDHG